MSKLMPIKRPKGHLGGSASGGKTVIGLDIGGTKITGIVYDGIKILHELTIVTPNNLGDFQRNLLKLVDFLSASGKPAAVGIGIAGLVDSKKGVVVYSPNMKFIKNFNIVSFLTKNGYKNVKADNDANCFTQAELKQGVGKKYKNFLGLTLGTGIGGGIVIDGKIFRGVNNAGAELGHIVQGNYFLEHDFQIARDQRSNPALGKILGKGFASMVNIFAPEVIILGGGVSTDKTRNFIGLAQKEMKKYLFNPQNKTKILVSNLKKVGAIGAALLVI